jgi:osmotically-inducible protein OsmY
MNAKRLVVLLMCMMFVACGLVACSRARSDAEITSDVEAKIHADAALAAAPITIQSNSGVVVLSGSVDTDAARSSAENTAKQVQGARAQSTICS